MNHWPSAETGPVSETFAIGLLRRMLEIDSPSHHEALLARTLVTIMRELGFSAYVDETGNAVGEIVRGDGPTVMLLGHMDTVPGTLPVRSISGSLYGRGAVDAKGPLAAMICAAAGTPEFRGRVVVIGVVEEETPCSRGAMAIRQNHTPPDALIIGEPSGWSSVVIGYKGKLDLRYQVTVPPTHPSNPVPKASELAVRCWDSLVDLLPPQPGHAVFDQPTPTLVSINGGLAVAEMELSVRTSPGFDSAALVRDLRDRLDGAGELTVVNSVAACRTHRRDPVVRALFAGIAKQQGRATAKLKTATSDMNTLAEVWDVPMATYGPGDSSLDHSEDEHIVLADYLRGIAVLSSALNDLSDLPYHEARRSTLAGPTSNAPVQTRRNR
ncbi:M20/M25/M40 family metallo-hydrolase [Sphaerisporangium album]|uniref:M20/M25/M40 family metallo-hydrolase n=1 Tax=Sphaerisporangium album TaxID=509200 RepID=A0A367FP03_9ACTN|nr:M20/M25/M40 family metallo-hydrolase [Sphaerisporangium album]RCG32136.1 M20/M25/M40 family metallo-hydrolase [Sphaerisporangium album]